ncbi:EAL domain-containing response regulator [Sulfurimonas sp. MAG313]|nr:EAL domain-containing response regulator [Sulfurimonas sp. MAG313]MDF1881044.1 EAL domain-containing response regulator [Sulfurimonas sp. MAG313]
MNKLRLIVVDDEAELGSFFCDIAMQEGFITQQFTSSRLFKEEYPDKADVILLDLMMPDIDGIEVIRFLAEKKSKAQLILMSGFDAGVLHSAEQLAIEQKLNLITSVSKPFRANELRELLRGLDTSPEIFYHRSSIEKISLSELELALVNDELVVYYQPKIGIKNSSCVSVEALVRWQHPRYGLISPDKFIPMAEERGLIDALTWVVMEVVMKQCSLWRAMDINISVAINMSASTLKDLSVPEKIDKLLNKYELKASDIILEVTETALMQELIKSLDILTRLRLKGFKLSIDDFGTGYSSLVQLHRVPFTEIKIDQSFIMNMLEDKESLAIAETVVVLGHKLGMTVVAEGVESKEVLDVLLKMRCDIAQGYYISKPKPADVITQWILEQLK